MKALLPIILLLGSSHTWAIPEFNGLVAGAVTYENLPYEGVDERYNPGVLILGRWGDLFIEGNRVGYPLKRLGWGTLSALGQIRTHQYLDADDSPLTDKDRNKALELGAQLSVPLGQGFVSQFAVLQDISGQHKAQEVEASIYKRVNLGPVRLVTTLALQYQSQDLLDYYVGTDSYQAKADLTGELELLATWPFADNWAVTAVGRFYQHGNEFSDSPLTNGDYTQRIALGIGHYF